MIDTQFEQKGADINPTAPVDESGKETTVTADWIKQAASHYGDKCSFEKLVKAGSWEHNGLRYEHVIPWTSDQDEWVKQETRITGSTIQLLESGTVRNFLIHSTE